MDARSRYTVIASALGAVASVGVIIFLLFGSSISNIIQWPRSGDAQPDDSNSSTTLASGEAPRMILVVLAGNEDSSAALVEYEPNNEQPIHIPSNAHIRFDSPDYRTAESMRALAIDSQDGGMEILRKSYDVNNEFFVNLDNGDYALRLEATWFEKGTYIYNFNIAVI